MSSRFGVSAVATIAVLLVGASTAGAASPRVALADQLASVLSTSASDQSAGSLALRLYATAQSAAEPCDVIQGALSDIVAPSDGVKSEALRLVRAAYIGCAADATGAYDTGTGSGVPFAAVPSFSIGAGSSNYQ
jgi:hypothetical protein